MSGKRVESRGRGGATPSKCAFLRKRHRRVSAASPQPASPGRRTEFFHSAGRSPAACGWRCHAVPGSSPRSYGALRASAV